MIKLFELNYNHEEEDAISRVIQRRWISGGPELQSFENEFSQHLNIPHAVALSNCTAALHLGLHCAGLGLNDEVILPSLTFVATANAILEVGAKPIFVDVTSKDELTIDPLEVIKAITPKTKGIMAMHFAGFMADMKSLRQIANEHNLLLFEDAAHSPGASRDGISVGQLSDFSCYSFYSNKNISCGEGGMLVTKHSHLADKAKKLRSHGLTTSAYDREIGKSFYQVEEAGFNYRMTDLHASLGRIQLAKYPEDINKRKERYHYYKKGLSSIPHVHIPFEDSSFTHAAYHIFVIRFDQPVKQELQQFLNERGIQTSFHYPAIHQFEQYRDSQEFNLPITEFLQERMITLPFHGNLDFKDIDRIIQGLKEFFE